MRISDWSSDVCSSDLIVQRIEDGQAAAKAGLKRGDVVTKINGKEITPQQTLSYIVANIKPGTRVPIEVIREGKTLSLTAVIGTRPPESELTGENFDPEAEQTLPEDPTGTADQAIQDQLGMAVQRSEEHTSELQSLMRNSYAVFCLNKKNKKKTNRRKAH